MNKIKLFLLSLCLTVTLSETDVFAAATDTKCSSKGCFKVASSAKGLYVNCYNDDIGRGDQQTCAKYFSGSTKSTCVMLESTINDTNPIATCDTSETAFCRTDDDCRAKGSQAITCVDKFGQRIEDKYRDSDGLVSIEDNYVGMCSSAGANKDRNGIVIVLCNAIGIVTGGAGRAVVLIVVVVVGVLFFIGKVNWSLLVAIGLGVGVMFGAKAIVNIVTGGELQC